VTRLIPARVPGSRFDHVERHYSEFHAVLSVSLTQVCPLQCSHCCVESGPTRLDKLDQGRLLEVLEEAAGSDTVRAVQVSGGEPFVRRPVLALIGEFCARNDLLLTIHTSAHWATTPDRARRILGAIPGLTQLQVSTDSYHQEFVSLQQVRNAVVAALGLGLVIQVAIVAPPEDLDAQAAKVRDYLGVELWQQLDVFLNDLYPAGRAAGEPTALGLAAPPGGCSLLNRPTVVEDGTIVACCNMIVPSKSQNSPLRIVASGEGGFAAARRAAENDFFLQGMRVGGPAYILQLLREHGASLASLRQFRSDDMCDACDALTNNPEIVQSIRTVLENPEVRREIAGSRAFLFSEPDMHAQLAGFTAT
jgi:organic radical activating enzyme